MAKQRRVGPQVVGWLIILGVLAAPVVYMLTREPVVEVTATALGKGRVEQTATAIASGTVMPRLDSMVASSSMGTVVNVPHAEGDRVEEGELLVEMNRAELDAQVRLAEANLRVGQSRLEQAKMAAGIYERVSGTQVGQTAAQLQQAKVDFERIKALSERGAISKGDLDKASLALKVSTETASAAKASQGENLVRQEEIKMAEANIEQLEAAIQVAKAARDNTLVKAPFGGVIAKILRDKGEAVTMGMPLLQLVEPNDSYVEAPFDEANAAEIKLGQKARINLDAYRDVDFVGVVEFISPVVTMNPDLSRTLNIRIKVEDSVEKFLPGMSADVVILISEKEDVLFAPTESLIRGEAAYVVDGGRARRRDIKTGLGNWNTVEITEGLNEGDMLITSVSLADLADGVRVKVVDSLDTQ